MKKYIFFLSVILSTSALAQVGINTDSPKATLDIVASPTDLSKTDGVIAPRISGNDLANKDSLYTTVQTGAIVYVTAAVFTPTPKTTNVTSAGYYYFDGSVWVKITSASVTADNGLTKTGNNIQLGGTLLNSTNISTAGFNTTFSGAGNFGIGSNLAPAEKLVVTGNSNISGKLRVGTTFNDASLSIKNNVGTEYIASFVSSGNVYRTVMLDNGNVGFGGIISPSENVDVNNNIRVRGINTNAGATTDKIVVADTNGILKTIDRASPLIGDVKPGFQTTDHSGWVRLDGRARNSSTLSSSQQAAATSLGFVTNLPNATNSYLSQNGTTLGSISNANTRTISQNNLPNIALSGNTNTVQPDISYDIKNGSNPNQAQIANGPSVTFLAADNINGGVLQNNVVNNGILSQESHNHTITTSSINGGVTQQALNIQPQTMSINMFVYLGQ